LQEKREEEVNERSQVRDFMIKLGICAVFAFLYSIGGSGDFGGIKALRRILAPAVLGGGMFYFSRDWRCLPGIPLLMAALTLPYGSETVGLAVLLRGVFGSACGVACGLYDALSKRWLLFGFQVALLVSAYISFGVFNPFPNARIEEGVLGFLVPFVPLMSARKR